jgi:hypothetical protein
VVNRHGVDFMSVEGHDGDVVERTVILGAEQEGDNAG